MTHTLIRIMAEKVALKREECDRDYRKRRF
jgi:hypothetical protein